ncbi:MAG: beta-ketoacyl synthase chain length factor [Betaproteobacteria bacterium]|nr:MAG: beta-ketoacyl synthase chain length factor [Betaproteobacteria bacterium]
MTRVFVEGIGLLGPGLQGWEAARRVLAGEEPFRPASTLIGASDLLPAAERRRTPVPVKLALAVGQEALQNAGRDAAATATVFASSSGEGEALHQMCEVLASAEREVSPTRFHNSVHNAAAGYWGIATRSQEASTSLCAYDASFPAGLVEAATQVVSWGKPVALIAYDQPYPEPLHSARPLLASFGAALVLAPDATRGASATFELAVLPGDEKPTGMSDSRLEELRLGIPAARALPLLEALARKTQGEVVLDFLTELQLRVTVSRC